MTMRERGRSAVRRWTTVLAVAGVVLTGATGIGAYDAITSTTASSTHSATSSSSSTTGLTSGSGASSTTSSGS